MTAMGEVYFDLDGTLTDPNIGITRSIRYALAKLDCAAPAEDELTWCIGPPLRASFRTMLGSDALADRALTFYRERFGDIGIYENTVYPGVVAILETLQASGRRLFVATSKPVVYASRIVEHFDMSGHFEQVFGSELGLPGRFRLVADVEALGVRLAGRAVIASIGAGAVQVSVGDVVEEIKADSVIVASGAVPDTSLADALHQAGIAARAVGDCRTIGRIEGANLDAAAVALAIG